MGVTKFELTFIINTISPTYVFRLAQFKLAQFKYFYVYY